MVSRKGLGYMIEAFIAIMTLFIFLAGSSYEPNTQNWQNFQMEIAANDLGNALKSSGHMDSFARRAETGSIQTAVETLSDNRYHVSGSLENLPAREKTVAFHTNNDEILSETTGGITRCTGDLNELDSEYPIKSTDGTGLESGHSNQRIYFADTDPGTPGNPGFNGEEDYDTLWVDRGTNCQFNSSMGPIYLDDFFKWGNSYYDFKHIAENGDRFIFYNADQAYRFKNTLEKPVNGVPTRTKVDTFNFSTSQLSNYDTLIFRERDALSEIHSSNHEKRLMDYLKTGSALFLMDLTQSDLNSGFLSRTDWKWVDAPTQYSNLGTRYASTQKAQRLKTLMKGLGGGDPQLSPGGKISSNPEKPTMTYAKTMSYDDSVWESEDLSMSSVTASNTLPGTPTSCSGDYRRGTLEKPSGTPVDAMTFELDCSEDTWGAGIDINDNGKLDNNEKIFVNADKVEIEDKKFYVLVGGPGCGEGECIRLRFAGNDRVETINTANQLEGGNINKIARAGHETVYTKEERRLLSATIHWLSQESLTFGDAKGEKKTQVIGSVNENTYMPYRMDLRWNR